jgi:hypothetical protein
MRRIAFLVVVLLTLALPWVATGRNGSELPPSHGADPASIDSGDVAGLAPAGGPTGKKLAPGARGKVAGVHARDFMPTQWCGTETNSDDTAHEVDNGPYKFHAVYVIPSDGADRFAQFANTMQSDAFAASALLETTYDRAIRFDVGTSCGPQYMDISVVRLPQSTVEMQRLAPTPSGTLQAVSDGLDAAGFPTIRPTDTYDSASTRTRNYVVWLDAPAPPGACGQATSYSDPSRDESNLNNLGGKVAIVFPNGPDAFCSATTVRHEIGHNLGALQPQAPHAFDGAHCNDAYEDTMCYSNSPRVTASGERGQFFDYKNDDYWDPPSGTPLKWWTANLNRFLCADATCNVVAGATPSAPEPPATSGPQATPTTKTVKPTLRMKARRTGRKWLVAVTVKGQGRAVVTLRCRPQRGRAVTTVLSRRTTLPRTVRARVTCSGKPRAAVKQTAAPGSTATASAPAPAE